MNLLQQIKSDRAQKKKKEPFRPTLYDRVSGVVQEYRLQESFLEKLESPEDFLQEKEGEIPRVRAKQPFRIPLFSLLEQKEYNLTLAIFDKINNPYLEFAQSPEEIALSKLLFELNPSVETEKLERYHFETLLLYERAKINIKELTYRKEMDPGVEKPNLENEGLLQDSLEKRMEQLESFIAKIEESQVK